MSSLVYRFGFIFLSLSTLGLAACNEKVKVGPKVRKEINEGREAKAQIETEKDEQQRVVGTKTRLQEELANMIDQAIRVESLGKSELHIEDMRDSGACSIIINSTGRLYADIIQSHIKDAIESLDRRSCKRIFVSAPRVDIPALTTLKTDGRHLAILADLVVWGGKVDTSPAAAIGAVSGSRAGDFKIRALRVVSLSGSELVTKGGDAGEYILGAGALSEKQIREARERAVRLAKWDPVSPKPIRLDPAFEPVEIDKHLGIADSYSLIESQVVELMRQRAPGQKVNTPNPFGGANDVVRVNGQDYFWTIGKREMKWKLWNSNEIKIELRTNDDRQGGAPGRVEILTSDDASLLDSLKIEDSFGDVPLRSAEADQVVAATKINEPLKLKRPDQIIYEFALMTKKAGEKMSEAKEVRRWTLYHRTGKFSNAEIKPVVELTTAQSWRLRQERRADAMKLSPQQAEASTRMVLAGFKSIWPGLESLIEVERSISLPAGLNALRDWEKSWSDLEQRVQKVQIDLKSK